MEELNKIMRDIFLSKSHIISQYSLNKELEENSNLDIEEYVNYHIDRGILEQLNHNTGIAELYLETPVEKIYRKEVFVCSPKILKWIVNSCIQLLSDEQIKEIKDGREI